METARSSRKMMFSRLASVEFQSRACYDKNIFSSSRQELGLKIEEDVASVPRLETKVRVI